MFSRHGTLQVGDENIQKHPSIYHLDLIVMLEITVVVVIRNRQVDDTLAPTSIHWQAHA